MTNRDQAYSISPGIYDTQFVADLLRGQDATPMLTPRIAKVLISESPRHARHADPQLNPAYEHPVAEKFDIGTVAHRLLLEPDRPARVEIVDAKDWRTAAARDAREKARDAGKVPLLSEQWDQVREMLAVVDAEVPRLELDPPAFTDGQRARTLVWEDRGVLCRMRVDYVHSDFATVDEFTTTSATAHPVDWPRRSLWSIGMDVKAVMARRAIQSITGVTPTVRIIVAESQPPYGLVPIGLAPSAVDFAETKVTRAVEKWQRCVETGEWPGYVPRLVEVDAPGHLRANWHASERIEQTGEDRPLLGLGRVLSWLRRPPR